jgi:hypothetical protein
MIDAGLVICTHFREVTSASATWSVTKYRPEGTASAADAGAIPAVGSRMAAAASSSGRLLAGLQTADVAVSCQQSEGLLLSGASRVQQT